MKKLWFIFCMGIVCMFGTTACLANKEAQAKIQVLVDKTALLADDMKAAYEKHKKGELTTEELSDLTSAIKTNIEQTKDEVMKLKEDGVGWGELIVSVLIGAASRGVPSKGPLASLFSVFTARRKEE